MDREVNKERDNAVGKKQTRKAEEMLATTLPRSLERAGILG
jgi:hypothetical protein